MAQTKKGATNAPTKQKTQTTAAEMREWYEKNKSKLDNFAKAQDALVSLRDLTKNKTFKNISNFNKETLKEYLKNISSSESNLRNLSRFLYYRSMIYYRLCKYYANQIDLSIMNVIPYYNPTKKVNQSAIYKSYISTLEFLDNMNLQYEFFKAYMICMREDVFYGCAYVDSDGNMFILPLDPDYCKITGVYTDSSFAFSMDMSYFKKNQELLDFWGEPFVGMYKEYERTGTRYQLMPDEYCVCLKFRAEDWETVVPVFVAMFLSIIDLLDKADLQSVKDVQDIYKLIWLEMKTLGNDVDDWAVNPDVMIKYFGRMVDEALPDYISAAIVPGELHEISFPDDDASEVTKIEKATKEILNSAGGAQILNLSSASNSTAFKYGVMMDSEFVLSSLIPQTQAIVNRLLNTHMSHPAKVKFFEVGVYQREDFKKSILESCQNGEPNKLLYNSINGISPLDTLSMNYLEENILHLSDILKPFNTSYTQSSNKGGGQEKPDSELSDEGLETRDKNKNEK